MKSTSFSATATSTLETDFYAVSSVADGKNGKITKANVREDLAASDTAKGTVERATNAEAVAGTDTTRYVTPYHSASVVVASDTVLAQSDSTSTTTSTSYVKAKEIVANVSGTYRIAFGLLSNAGGDYGFGRIYKNGVAFGTERTTISTSEQTYTEDLAFSA